MKSNTLVLSVGLAVIGVGGFMAGRYSAPESSDVATDPISGVGDGDRSTTRSRGSDATARDDRRLKRDGSGLSPSSPESMARFTSILRNEDALDRNRALFGFIDRLGPDDFKSAVDHFRSLGLTESRPGEYALLLSAWAKMDPLSALDYAKTNTEGRFAADTVLATWASRDPDAALLWAESNHDGKGPNPYLAGVIRGIAETHPERATELLVGMPKSTERSEALKGILPQLLAQGADATRSWIDSLENESIRNEAMRLSAAELADMDPATTAGWLLANPGAVTKHQMDEVFGKWVRQDQQAALDSLDSIPTGEGRSGALRGVIATVAVSDPATALEAMNRFPEDTDEKVMKSFLWYSLESDPGLAVTQISRIPDEDRRDWWYGRTLESWMNKDASAAKSWIRANPPSQSVLDYVEASQSDR